MSARKELLDELLAKPVGPAIAPRKNKPEDFTRKLEVKGDTATGEIRADAGTVNEGTAKTFLMDEGLDPSEWEVTGFRKSEWGDSQESVRFTYQRRATARADVPLDDLLKAFKAYRPGKGVVKGDGDHGFVIALGDMQFGKIDGDGVEGTLERTLGCINRAADTLAWYRKRYDIGHIHIAWLGDHIEGFESQGGANVWRTPLTLSEQIRLTRRVMQHALLVFAPLADRVTMAAVPGNHGEAVRIDNSGLTRYDDSHDTESLIAVSDAIQLAQPDRFAHVEFFVPETDELTVVTEIAGTVLAHAHGHQWRPGKHFDWWKGQAFDKASAMHQADILLAGHLHHELTDTDGWRTFIQPPAMESESTWWRHKTGTNGAPGLVVAVTKDGLVKAREVVR